jgi:hypothetical protein
MASSDSALAVLRTRHDHYTDDTALIQLLPEAEVILQLG